jgi:hypothetical protein
VKRPIRTGPKRLRWRRRDWSGSGGDGQVRRWGATDGNFKLEREARRAGLTGKLGKHPGQGVDPSSPFINWDELAAYASHRASASYGREADSD